MHSDGGATIDLLYAVYLDCPPPNDEELEDALDVWLDSHADPPWPQLVRQLRGSQAVQVGILRREDVPPLPDGLVAADLEPDDARRLARSRWVLAVAAQDTPLAPRPGLVAAHACALAWAHAFDGIVVDPCAGRAYTVEGPHARLRARQIPPVTEHLTLQHASTGWCTAGMAKYGTLDLFLSDDHVPAEGPERLLLAVAQALAERVSEGESVVPGCVVRVSRAHADRASGRASPRLPDAIDVVVDEGPPLPGGPSWSIRQAARMPIDRWRHRASLVLGRDGGEDQDRARARAERLWLEAHDRAVNEFPRVRDSILAGVRVGTEIYVRRAFPSGEGRRTLLWVAVTDCRREVVGTVADTAAPQLGLAVGQQVRFPLYDVYDWMIRHPDGRVEGGYTLADQARASVESRHDTV